MTRYRPPIGGLFRVSAPRSTANAEAGADAQREAREAIRNFMAVLEKLDRHVGTGTAATRASGAPRRRAAHAGSHAAEGQP